MTFGANVSKPIKIICIIMAIISACGCAVAVMVFAGVRLEITTGQATLLISVCPIAAIIALLLATIHYKVTDTHLKLNIGFLDILGGRIRIDKILNIVIKDKKMYISFLWQGADPVIAQIAISPNKYEAMKDLLMAKNKQIVFFDEDNNEVTDSKQQ